MASGEDDYNHDGDATGPAYASAEEVHAMLRRLVFLPDVFVTPEVVGRLARAERSLDEAAEALEPLLNLL